MDYSIYRILRRFSAAILLVASGATVSAQGASPPDEADFRMENVAANLDSPWSIAFIDSGRALVTLRKGELVSIDLKTRTRTRVSGVPRIRVVGQGGLLDVVLAPDFSASRELFFSFSADSGSVQATAVARARLPVGANSMEDWRVVFTANNRTGGGFHFGSRLAFDRDGCLVVTVGERNERDRARNLRDHGGKVLRITREGRPAPGNPFSGRGDALGEILSLGHRNPQGLAVHPATGNIWMHEHGPRGGDEINVIRAGADYGWPLVTYGREYSGQQVGEGRSSAPGIVEPLLHWTPSIAPSGMAFISGTVFPAWQGDLLVGALAGTELRLVELDGERVTGQKTYLKGWARIRDVRQGPDGLVYLLTDGSGAGLWRLLPR
jgi:glucose/arabinose dehydrogenase